MDVSRTTTFCMTTTRFMSHNLVVQSCITKLPSVWTHLKESAISERVKRFSTFFQELGFAAWYPECFSIKAMIITFFGTSMNPPQKYI